MRNIAYYLNRRLVDRGRQARAERRRALLLDGAALAAFVLLAYVCGWLVWAIVTLEA